MTWVLRVLLLAALLIDLSGIMVPATGDESFFLGSVITLGVFLGPRSVSFTPPVAASSSRGMAPESLPLFTV